MNFSAQVGPTGIAFFNRYSTPDAINLARLLLLRHDHPKHETFSPTIRHLTKQASCDHQQPSRIRSPKARAPTHVPLCPSRRNKTLSQVRSTICGTVGILYYIYTTIAHAIKIPSSSNNSFIKAKA